MRKLLLVFIAALGLSASLAANASTIVAMPAKDIAVAATYKAKEIKITSPANGSTIAFGTQQTISWETDIPDGLTVALYRDGVRLASSVSGIGDAELRAHTESLTWNVPACSSALPAVAHYTVRVSSSTDSDVYGESIVPFSLAYIFVSTPADGSRWSLGTTHNITWSADTNVAKRVNLKLYRDGVFYSAIASSIMNTGAYSWMIPDDGSFSPSPEVAQDSALVYDYYVVVESGSDASYKNESVNNFRLEQNKTINVLAPNGAESWGAGQSYNIKWFSTIGGHVTITLGYFDAQENWNQAAIIAEQTSDSGNINIYRWRIPEDVTPRADYHVKIVGNANVNVSDVSDSNFTISSLPFITVTSPNGGERWTRGNAYDITWNTNVTGPVDIYYLEFCSSFLWR